MRHKRRKKKDTEIEAKKIKTDEEGINNDRQAKPAINLRQEGADKGQKPGRTTNSQRQKM